MRCDENRKIAHTLVVPDFDSISLTEQLYNLADSMLIPSGISATIDTTGIDKVFLDNKYNLSLYRIAQEQCSNIVKYAVAKNVSINLYLIDSTLRMTISDDGIGASLNSKTTALV